MNKETFLALVADTFGVEVGQVSMDLKKGDIAEWDSFAHLKLFMALEGASSVKFSTAEIESLTSLSGIYNRLAA